MNEFDIRMLPTYELLAILGTEISEEVRNMIIYELTVRVYVPGKGISFEDLLEDLGYHFPTNDLGEPIKKK